MSATRIDCPILQFPSPNGLLATTQKILKEEGGSLLGIIKSRWTGWKNPTGRSQAAWKIEITPTSVAIINDAQVGGKFYTQYVHRAGQRQPEVDRLGETVIRDTTRKISIRLGAALAESATPQLSR